MQDLLSLQLLACPCPEHAKLVSAASVDSLKCAKCGRLFPVRDGIVTLFVDEIPAALPESGA